VAAPISSTSALASPPALASRRRPGLALWHLLSLDAPTVAVLWTWFLASGNRLRLPALSLLSIVIAVWMLYAADRLLDARHLLANPLHTAGLEHRHHFHHRHRSAFLLGILAASLSLALLIPRLPAPAIHLYLILGALLAGYLVLIHATGSAHRLPKEIAVGLFFSAAVFIPTVARAPTLRPSLLPAAALFAMLCSLNCLFIYRWEHPTSAPGTTRLHRPHPVTRGALRFLNPLTIALACISTAYSVLAHSPVTPAIGLSALLLLLLDRYPTRLNSVTLRAAADLALTTPILFVPWLLKAV